MSNANPICPTPQLIQHDVSKTKNMSSSAAVAPENLPVTVDILTIDSWPVVNSLRKGIINTDMHDITMQQLVAQCGFEHLDWTAIVNQGNDFLRRTNVHPLQQRQRVLEVLMYRKEMLSRDERVLNAAQKAEASPTTNVEQATACSVIQAATIWRMNINRKQIGQMTAWEAQSRPAHERCTAGLSTFQFSTAQNCWFEVMTQPKLATHTSNDTQPRVPLAPIKDSNSKVTSQNIQGNKRKRDESETKKPPVVISRLDDSDDESTLQSQVDMLQTRIAAIRERNAGEDVVVAQQKKAKTQGNANGAVSKNTAAVPQSFQHTKGPSILGQPSSSAPENPRLTSGYPQSSYQVPQSTQPPLKNAYLSSQPTVQPSQSSYSSSQSFSQSSQPVNPSSQASYMSSLYNSVASQLTNENSSLLTENSQLPGHLANSLPPAAQQQTSPPSRDLTEPVLCAEQQNVVDLIMAGHNVFYTGSAGCGKSTVLKSFIPKLREQGKTVRIVAPTGKAALDINGSTTWTFAGWTPLHMKKPLEQLKAQAHGKYVSQRLIDTDVLVIDEISMVENHLFERLNAIMKEVRDKKQQRPFGNVQLVVTGDFCQLPPVKPFQHCITCGKEQRACPGGIFLCPEHGECHDDDKWAFRSAAWEACNFKHVNLTNIHRQSDEVFIKILQKLRIGSGLTEADRKLLLDHPCDVTDAVKLFPTRDEVRRINQTEFDKLQTTKHSYVCLDYFSLSAKHPHTQSKGRRMPPHGSLEALREHKLDVLLEFKRGMLVVLLVNLDIDAGLVNGSQGRIVGFEAYDKNKLPKARGDDERSRSTYSGKSGKWAGSPVPSSLRIKHKTDLRGDYAILREEQIQAFIEQSCNKSRLWPVVRFDNGIQRTVFADCQINELGDEGPYTLLGRTQIPLVAAWAMTIHKSQGMTLNRVIVDLGKSFEEGQEYVALSRARSLDGLKVVSLGSGRGKAGNPQVRKFLLDKFGIQ